MLLIINTLLFEYGMALWCDCVLILSNLSAVAAHTNRDKSMTDETFQLFFFLPRGPCSILSLKKNSVFSLGEPLLLLLLLKEGTLYRRETEVLYLQQR